VKPKRIALYARVSTKDKGQDTENLLAQLRDFCGKQDWAIIHEFIEHVSGKTADKRRQFQAMLAAASRHEFDLVLFWSFDRFSRAVGDRIAGAAAPALFAKNLRAMPFAAISDAG
jgi:DNA invertase Pin-like site-specific DNA recombinase